MGKGPFRTLTSSLSPPANDQFMRDDLRRLILKTGWAPACVVVFHAAVSSLTAHGRAFDPVMHFLGGAAIAYVLWHATAIFKGWFGDPKPLARSFIAFCAAATVAVFWEFAEFSSGELLGAYSQLSLKETMGDLFMGCLGAGAYLLAAGLMRRMKPRSGD